MMTPREAQAKAEFDRWFEEWLKQLSEARKMVATNYRVDRETATLGEAWPAIKRAEEAYQAFRAALEEVQRGEDQRADTAASEFLMALADAAHDASWAGLVGDARDAFGEARVRRVGA